MSKYMDLVVVRTQRDDRDWLCVAPVWSGLKEDDEVICERDGGVIPALVRKVITIDADAEVMEVILYLAKAEMPLKRVVSKVEYREFTYKEESNDTV